MSGVLLGRELVCILVTSASTLRCMRPTWESLPLSVKDAVESILGFPVARAESQRGGFSPGVAARVWGPAGEPAFVKAVSAEVNPHTPGLHRDEARFAALLPAGHPSPRLLGSWDAEPWVALVSEQVTGHEPGRPWTAADLSAAIAAIDAQALVRADPALPTVWDTHQDVLRGWRELAEDGTPLTPWEARHLDALVEIEAGWRQHGEGDAWLHLDARGDNMVVRPDGTAVLVDWPWSCAGAAVFDAIGFIPSAVHGGAVPGPVGPACEALLGRFASGRAAAPEQVTTLVATFAGLMAHRMRQPPPPGMPTVRALQARQHEVCVAWLTHRTGWG